MQLSQIPVQTPTPFYYYNLELLKKTVQAAKSESAPYGYRVHYAVKANANPVLLRLISQQGLGADCVSGNEIRQALECGFAADTIVYAGVGKSDAEIELALQHDIFCFNCESLPEIQVIDGIAARLGKKARIALRINPNVDAHTHHYITTGIEENKFGIYLYDLEHVITEVAKLKQIELIGLHFHIGSQITDMTVFRGLCIRANEIQRQMKERGLFLPHINFGGGLGIDYNEPYEKPIADFQSYFATFARFFEPEPHQQIHFELGRSIVAHCGDLISKVLYVKEGKNRKFVIRCRHERSVAPGPLSGLSQDRKYQLRPTRREIRRGRTDMRICRLFRERRRLKRNPPGRSHRYPFLRSLRRSNGFPL